MTSLIIQYLNETPSRNDKIEILRTHYDDKILRDIFFYAYNPYYNYYIRKVREYCTTTGEESSIFNYSDMFTLLDKLRERVFTGNDALVECVGFVENSDEDIGEMFMRILEGDMDCGVQLSTVNKVWKNLIPKFTCMLAQKGDPTFPCFAEEKYDGVRIITLKEKGVVKFYTRNGKSLDMPKIREYLEEIDYDDFMLDGEIIGVDRQSVSGLVTKHIRHTALEYEDETFRYMVFDGMLIEDWYNEVSEEFNERRKDLWFKIELSSKTGKWNPKRVILCDSILVNSNEEVDEFYKSVIEKGGEGLILKEPDHCYEWKRSKSWLKLKEENTIDLVVVDTLEGQGKYAGGIGSLLCETACGRLQVSVGSGLKEADIAAFNLESPIGCIVEVMYNTVIISKHKEEYSLFLPRFKGIREDKTEADSLTGRSTLKA